MDTILQKHVDDAIRVNNQKFLKAFLPFLIFDEPRHHDKPPPGNTTSEIVEFLLYGLFTVSCIFWLIRLPKRLRQQAKEKRMAEKEQKRDEIDREVKQTVQDLQAANEALIESMREAQASIGELRASVENLQSAVEELQTSEDTSEASDGDSQTSEKDSEASDGESQNPGDDTEVPDGESQTPEEDSPNPPEGSQTPVEDDDSSEQDWLAFIDHLDEYVDNCERMLSDSTATAAEKDLKEERQKLIARQDTIIEEVEREAAETEARTKTYPLFNERRRDLYGCMQPPSSVPV